MISSEFVQGLIGALVITGVVLIVGTLSSMTF